MRYEISNHLPARRSALARRPLRTPRLLFLLLLLTGCAPHRQALGPLVARGELGEARQMLIQRLPENRSDRAYLLDRMSLAVLTLADGYPQAAQATFEGVYDILRTQGVNADRTVASVVLNEGVKFWKGEPFEQALAMVYYGLEQATQGQWDNTRAAAQGALFNLRDYGEAMGTKVERIDTYAIYQRSIEHERGVRQAGAAPDRSDFLNSGFAVRESNFTLGYIVAGLASRQMGRHQEAGDFFSVAAGLDSRLIELLRVLRDGDYNTVLVVSYGLGPAKTAYGPDNALVRFMPMTPSDAAPLVVWTEASSGSRRTWPQVCDVNRMAEDHMWNSLEDVRQLKSLLGTGLLYGGAIATGIGADRGSREALYGGLAAMAAGAFLKAGAHADTRYCDALPQRFYIVPLKLTGAEPVHLRVEGKPGSHLVLAGLGPPEAGDEPVQLRYVRLTSGATAPAWATSGAVLYANDYAPAALPDEQAYPYVLGGRCVRLPTALAMRGYDGAGHLSWMSYVELASLLRGEGLVLEEEQVAGRLGRHVLEGGNVLVAPLPGTLGFARLFGQVHGPYQPRTQALAQLAASLRPSTPLLTQRGGRQP